jgi:branched-chain amino acid transport system substrate-binding protein
VCALALLGTACGSHRDSSEFMAANAEMLRRAGSSPATPAGDPAEAAAPASGSTVTVPDDGVPAASSMSAPAPVAGGAATLAPAQTAAGRPSSPAKAATPTDASPAAGAAAVAGGGRAPATAAGSSPERPAGGSVPGTPTPAPPGTSDGGLKSEIVLGSVGTDSGPAASPLTGIRDAARAWVADVNSRGGLNGHPVRLILGDDGGDPARAQSLVKRMVEVDKVHAMYATRGFLTESAYMGYLEQKQIPIIGTCVCDPVDGPSPMTFDVTVNISPGGAWMHVGPLIALSDKRKVALLYCREAPGCKLVRDDLAKHSKEWGFELVYETQNSIGQPDFTAEVIAARNSGADALISVNDGATSIRVLRSMNRQGWKPAFSAQPSHHEDRFLKEGGADVEGILVSSVTPPYNNSPLMADYRAAMDRWAPGGVRSSLGAGSGFLAGKLLEKISVGFGATVTTPDILEGLYALRNETLDGRIFPVTYPRDAPHDKLNVCIVPLLIQDGKYVAPKGDGYACAPGFKPPS